MLFITVGERPVSIAIAWFAARIASIFRQGCANLFQKIQSFTMEEVNRFTVPSLITKND